MGLLYETVKTIVFYLILVAIVMNLLGTSSYKKYVAMFTGMLLIYILISPIMKLVNLTDTIDYHTSEYYYRTGLKDYSLELMEGEEEQKKYILEEYKNKIGEQIELYLVGKNLYIQQCNIDIQEDIEEDNYGKVTGIYLVAEEKEEQIEKEERLIKEIAIEPVRIDKAETVLETGRSPNRSVKEIEIQKELEVNYQVEKEAVKVIID